MEVEHRNMSKKENKKKIKKRFCKSLIQMKYIRMTSKYF